MNQIKVYKNYIPLSAPINSSETPSYVNGVDKDLLDYANAPPLSFCNTKLVTNHFLPPAPRNQLVEDPVNAFARDTPYKIATSRYSMATQAGIEGIVQNQVNNANYVRGNQFSLAEARKRIEYSMEIPAIQTPKKNIVISNSPFYPSPNYAFTFNKDYQTYMHPKQYVNGMPITETFVGGNDKYPFIVGAVIVGLLGLLVVCNKN